jgi:CDP-diacylglycerol--glycerol-3-phosphate 3-phosphatidyltransferase
MPPTNPVPRAAAGPLSAPSAWNVANALTVLRLVLVPLFVWLLLRDGGNVGDNRLLAAGVFSVAILTDRFDGDIARRWNLVTDFGKIADPIADKALTGAAFIGLSVLGDLPWWVTGLVLFREWAVTALRFWVIRHGVMPASRGGKLKTVLQAVALVLYLLPWTSIEVVQWIAAGFMASAVAVTVITGVDYVIRGPAPPCCRQATAAVSSPVGGSRSDRPGELQDSPLGRLVRLLTDQGATMATAESLTGGMVGAALTEIPGSSAIYRGGVVVYATDLKVTLAGVPTELLAAVGPVHADTAAALGHRRTRAVASHVRGGDDRCGGAGPTGRDRGRHRVRRGGRPGHCAGRKLTLMGDRASVRRQTVEAALELAAELMAGAAPDR